ncbi:MAG: hypothetical protein ABL951_07925 [Alphaproteobacteria bacterium]
MTYSGATTYPVPASIDDTLKLLHAGGYIAGHEIGPWVDRLAARIASFPIEAVRAAKAAVKAADLPLQQGLLEEAYLFQTLLRNPSAQRNMARFLANGGQTREGELKVNDLSTALGRGA